MAREAENKRQGVPIGAEYWRHGPRWILAELAEGKRPPRRRSSLEAGEELAVIKSGGQVRAALRIGLRRRVSKRPPSRRHAGCGCRLSWATRRAPR